MGRVGGTESHFEGLIFLIRKEGGSTEEILRWRLITILNSTYKILAKTLSLRLQPMLERLIHHPQTGFIKKRSILDNIFTFWEAFSLAQLQGMPLVILILDFEKAYDRWDWIFLDGSFSTRPCLGCNSHGHLDSRGGSFRLTNS